MKKQIKKRPPQKLTRVGLNMFVNTVKLRKLPLPIVTVSIKKLLWHFDMPVWEKDGTDDWNLTPWEVIEKKKYSQDHRKIVRNANARYPIVVTRYKSELVILDGEHRLVKVYERGNTTIKAKIIPAKYLKMREFKS